MVGTTGEDSSVKIRCGLPNDKGLKVETVPGGLYRVRNLAGGVPPAPLGGLHTDMQMVHKLVLKYNQQVK
jgi:hypothetical protein